MTSPLATLIPQKRGGRALPLIIAAPVYLMILATLAATLVLASTEHWRQALISKWTIIVPVQDHVDQGEQVSALLHRLEAMPAIQHSEWLTGAARDQLFAPWFTPSDLQDLPVPEVIALTVTGSANRNEIEQVLKEAAPGSMIDDNASFIDTLTRWQERTLIAAAAIVALALLSVLLSIAVMTRLHTALHRDMLAILQLIGTTDRDLIRLMRRRAWMASIWGIVFAIAALMATVIFFGIGVSAEGLTPLDLTSQLSLPWLYGGIAAMIALLILAALAARATAGASVKRFLRQQEYL